MATQILIVEDDPWVARALERIYREFGRVQTASTGEAGLEWIARGRWSLLSIDIELPGKQQGFDLVRFARLQGYTNPIFVIGRRATDAHLSIAFALDAHVLPKGHEELRQTLREAVLTHVFLELDADDSRVIAHFGEKRLTATEREIVLRAANGSLDVEVEHELGFSPRAFKAHKSSIFDKLGRKGGPLATVAHSVRLAVHPDLAKIGHCLVSYPGVDKHGKPAGAALRRHDVG